MQSLFGEEEGPIIDREKRVSKAQQGYLITPQHSVIAFIQQEKIFAKTMIREFGKRFNP